VICQCPESPAEVSCTAVCQKKNLTSLQPHKAGKMEREVLRNILKRKLYTTDMKIPTRSDIHNEVRKVTEVSSRLGRQGYRSWDKTKDTPSSVRVTPALGIP
jgi:hypothetical protein